MVVKLTRAAGAGFSRTGNTRTSAAGSRRAVPRHHAPREARRDAMSRCMCRRTDRRRLPGRRLVRRGDACAARADRRRASARRARGGRGGVPPTQADTGVAREQGHFSGPALQRANTAVDLPVATRASRLPTCLTIRFSIPGDSRTVRPCACDARAIGGFSR